MSKSPILAGEPFSVEKTQQIIDQFARDGFCRVPGVLTDAEVTTLRERADELLDDPEILARFNPNPPGTAHWGGGRYHEDQAHATSGEILPFALRNCIDLDQMYRDILLREPIFALVETILGKDSKYIGQNVYRNVPGLAIDFWHTDGEAWFPLPGGIARHDPRLRMPILWFTVQVPLTDIEIVEHGPTQYVPGSHYSGRTVDRVRPQDHPGHGGDVLRFDADAEPEFEGRGPVSMFCKAGDIYLQDPMTWHRGSPNTSDRTRYLLQLIYASKGAYRVGHGFNQYTAEPVNTEMLRNGSDRFLNLLGRPRPDGA